jgi:hypothetical protein
MARSGALLIARGLAMKALIEEIESSANRKSLYARSKAPEGANK